MSIKPLLTSQNLSYDFSKKKIAIVCSSYHGGITEVLKNGALEVLKINQVGEIFNLGSDKPQSINKLVKLIGGKKIFIPLRPGEPKKTWANIKKIKNQLKWKPIVTFENGVKEMLKEINKWKNAPLWNPKSIKTATKSWFKYLVK